MRFSKKDYINPIIELEITSWRIAFYPPTNKFLSKGPLYTPPCCICNEPTAPYSAGYINKRISKGKKFYCKNHIKVHPENLKICPVCKIEFTTLGRQKQRANRGKYCSKVCYTKAQTKHEIKRSQRCCRVDYKMFRTSIFTRDSFTCQKCKDVGGVLEMHHIKPVNKFPELEKDSSNCITLCKNCHRGLHKGKPFNLESFPIEEE